MGSDFRDKKVTVVGLGKSGLGAARLLKRLKAEVYVTEANCSAEIEAAAAILKQEKIPFELGGHSYRFIQDKDLIIVSPGIGPESLPIKWAKELDIPIWSEIELGYQASDAPIIAVTGTNGKTTVTTLIAEILQKINKKIVVCGNIGLAFTGEVLKIKRDWLVVLEVSSFQLEYIYKFRPKIAVFLNLQPDHLDRYGDFQQYFQTKQKILLNQDGSDFAVLNYADFRLRGLKEKTRAKVIFFNRPDERDSPLNENEKASLAVAEILGVEKKICLEHFAHFKGVQHRYEFVTTIRGVDFINDSKATNIDSTIWAINLSKKPLILLAGGRDKNQDFRRIRPWIKEKVKLLVLFGECREKIRTALEGISPIKSCLSLPEAVEFAFREAKANELILLSPMCASFDAFINYEQRGNVFKEIVFGLKEKIKV